MDSDATNTSRRVFFLRGGAALGAGVAAGSGAGAALAHTSLQEPVPMDIQGQLATVREREAIRELHLAFTRLMEQRQFEAAADLFDERAELALSGETASGRSGIAALLANGYRNQTVGALHEAYRANAQQQHDSVTFSQDRQQARAIWHVDVALGVPLRDDSTAAQMARLQGQLAERRWESGRLEAGYVKSGAGWKMSTLRYSG